MKGSKRYERGLYLPNFPTNYYRFCEELRRNGVSVLGIGDCPYEQLTPELKAALTEYYKVGKPRGLRRADPGGRLFHLPLRQDRLAGIE